MPWSTEAKVRAGFAVALTLLLLVDTVALLSVRRLTRTVHWQVQAYKVLEDLDELLSLLQDAETGQRGFLLTGEEHYLEPYRTSVTGIHRDVLELRELTADNPAYQRQLDHLEPLVERKLSELQATLDLHRSHGIDAALELVRTGDGKESMDGIRAVIATLKQAETALLSGREASARTGARRATTIILAGNALGLALLAVAFAVIRRDERQRRAAETDLRRAHDLLEIRVAERTSELSLANTHLRSEIEHRARAETKLEDALHRLESSRDDLISILDQLAVAAAITDPEGRVTFLSRAARRSFGRNPEAFVGKPWEDLFPFRDDDKARLYQLMARPVAERGRAPVRIEVAPGRHWWMEVEIQDDPREPRRRIFFFHDVTALYDLRRQLDEKGRFHDLVGRSEPAQQVFQQIRQLAAVDSTVLIEGETGTGKELAARAIHHHSPRAHRPFVAVNLAGLSSSLLSSQLFGHKRGAFTGAVADHHGYFEAAHGGTLFLDEIGDMPAEAQTALLRVLQEREVVRLGETRPRKVDVRVLAATQHDLARAVEQGRFRSDLLYRVRVGRIVLPPLRNRREDIPLLVTHFLAQCRAATGRPIDHISHEAMTILLDHSWPGNVRELKGAIEFATIRCTGAVLQASDLPPEILDSPPRLPPHPERSPDPRQRVLDALERAGGNRTDAARTLGISRATLYRRLTRLGIPHRETDADTQPKPAE
ncbi:MAG: sigma 54-interacting transcriptional regulator [Verrucomicrobiae bacterium]|nr:sigma 54-interacting transcriptional regulator [Verrucomicrobiae bacterium]